MKKENEKSLEDYINQFKKDEYDRIIKILKEMMPDAIKNANSHFIEQDFEKLSNDCQHEHEGLMWGWQDAIKTALKNIEKFN